MSDSIKFPQTARNPLAWGATLLLAALAWIPTLQQTLSMLSMRMYGTMGLSLLPFLLFWMLMMVGMMLPSLAPTISQHLASIQWQTPRFVTRLSTISCFLLGYLLIWLLSGIPIFLLCLLGNDLIRSSPSLGIALGMVLFVGAGIYQFTPLKKRILTHCYIAVDCEHIYVETHMILSYGKAGIRQGFSCLQYCGPLMLIMIAVGLMNLFWMVLLTFVIFIEKIWFNGNRLSAPIGVLLIMYGLLAFVDPALLPGLYVH
jgi:predicted metal-binding membrane protein